MKYIQANDYVMELLRGDMGFICQYPKTACFETIWSSIFDPSTLSIQRAEGDPRKKKFVFDNRLVKKKPCGQ